MIRNAAPDESRACTPIRNQTRAMNGSDVPAPQLDLDLSGWKAEEARDRMARIASGQSGAWPWPDLPIQHAVSPDADWLLELDLAGN